MFSLNKVCLIGNIGKDPEIRAMQSGDSIANLSLYTKESYKDKKTGEWKSNTEWHKISVFNQQLVKMITERVVKGSKLYVEGSIATREYEDKSGVKKFVTEIKVTNFDGKIVFLDPKESTGSVTPDSPTIYSATTTKESDIDDEIPF